MTIQEALRVFNLNKLPDEDELKKVYRDLVKKYHPDTTKDPIIKTKCHRIFIEITEGYQVLSNELKQQDTKEVIIDFFKNTKASEEQNFTLINYIEDCFNFATNNIYSQIAIYPPMLVIIFCIGIAWIVMYNIISLLAIVFWGIFKILGFIIPFLNSFGEFFALGPYYSFKNKKMDLLANRGALFFAIIFGLYQSITYIQKGLLTSFDIIFYLWLIVGFIIIFIIILVGMYTYFRQKRIFARYIARIITN